MGDVRFESVIEGLRGIPVLSATCTRSTRRIACCAVAGLLSLACQRSPCEGAWRITDVRSESGAQSFAALSRNVPLSVSESGLKSGVGEGAVIMPIGERDRSGTRLSFISPKLTAPISIELIDAEHANLTWKERGTAINATLERLP